MMSACRKIVHGYLPLGKNKRQLHKTLYVCACRPVTECPFLKHTLPFQELQKKMDLLTGFGFQSVLHCQAVVSTHIVCSTEEELVTCIT